MMKCVGVAFKSGTFQDDRGRSIDFDNVILYCVVELQADNLFGVQTAEIKMKRVFLEGCLGGPFDPNDLIDQEVSLEYTPINNRPTLTGVRFFKSL